MAPYSESGGFTTFNVEQNHPIHDHSLRSIFERFSLRMHPDRSVNTPLSELILDTQTFESLPFPIALTDGGYTISRMGEPFKEETGIRVFIVDTKQLEALYESKTTDPEDVYEALKRIDLGGRLLCLGDSTIRLNREKTPEWTLIVKKIEHPHKNHWKTPDVLRLNIVPDSDPAHASGIIVNQRIVETELAFLDAEPINLTNTTRDCPLHFVEPWMFSASQAEMIAFDEHMQKINATDEQREGAIDQFDRHRNMRRSNTNTVLMKTLRSHVGTIPAPPIEGYMVQDPTTGEISLQFERSEGLYDRIMALPEHSEARAKILKGLPTNMTIESMGNDSYGVNGIEYDNIMHLFHGAKRISVPLLSPNKDRATYTLYFGAHTIHRRKAMTLDVIRVNNQVFASITSGIEEGDIIEFGTRQERTIFSYEQNLNKEQLRLQAQRSGKTVTQQHQEDEAEKKRREEAVIRKANPFAYSRIPPKSIRATIHR